MFRKEKAPSGAFSLLSAKHLYKTAAVWDNGISPERSPDVKKLTRITLAVCILSLALHLSSCTPVLVWIQELEFDCLDQALKEADLLPDKEPDAEEYDEETPHNKS